MQTKIINLDARSNFNITQFFQAGDYQIEYIGKANGGSYNAFNYNYNRTGLWSNAFTVSSSEFNLSVNSSPTFASEDLALASGKGTTFVLSKDGIVNFSIFDTFYSDNTGGISLRITSIPTPATNIILSNSSISEKQPINTVIGHLSSIDPDPGDNFKYSLVTGAGDTDNRLFSISNNQLISNAIFDHSTSRDLSIRVRTTDQDGQIYEKQLTINVSNTLEAGTFEFSDSIFVYTEDGKAVKAITINRSGRIDRAARITILARDGTATANSDYTNTPIIISFAEGESSKTIDFSINNDGQFEGIEVLELSLSDPTNGARLGTKKTAILKIIDNDGLNIYSSEIQATRRENLALPIPTALKRYEDLGRELDQTNAALLTAEEHLQLANDDYSFAKEVFEKTRNNQAAQKETLLALEKRKAELSLIFSQLKAKYDLKLTDLQQSIDSATIRLQREINPGIKNAVEKEINGYLIQVKEYQDLLSVATTRFKQDLAVIDYQIAGSKQELQSLNDEIVTAQIQSLEQKSLALFEIKSKWERLKQTAANTEQILDSFLSEYSFLKTKNRSSGFLQGAVDHLKQTVGSVQSELSALKSSGVFNPQIAVLESSLKEKQAILEELQSYQDIVVVEEQKMKREFEIRSAISAEEQEVVRISMAQNSVESYVNLVGKLAQQLQGSSTIWAENLEASNKQTIKLWNQSQTITQAVNTLTTNIEQNLSTPFGNYYLNEIQLDEALQIHESTTLRRDALSDSVKFVEEALYLAKKQVQEYQDLAKLGEHYSRLIKYETQYALLNRLRLSLQQFISSYTALTTAHNNVASIDSRISSLRINTSKYSPLVRPETGNLYFLTSSMRANKAQDFSVSIGGNLVTVNDIQEQLWITDNFGTNFWIGLTDDFQKNGPWRWFSGEPYAWESWQWKPGQPDNDGGGGNQETYVVSLGRINGWNDDDWDDSHRGLVEVNLKALYDERKGAVQNIKIANTSTFNTLSNLVSLLKAPQISPILQGSNTLLIANYLQKYNDVLAGSGQMIDETVLKKFLDEAFTPVYKSYSGFTTSSPFDPYIANTEPPLIIALTEEISNKLKQISSQVDLDNDLQEQWIEIGLQKYIDQKRTDILGSDIGNDQTTSKLQSLLVETAYLIQQAQKNPDKLQDYLQRRQSISTLVQEKLNSWEKSNKPSIDGTFAISYFKPSKEYWVSNNNYNFQTGDFNGDGKTDLIHFVNDGGPGYVHPWLSNGDGTFSVKQFKPANNYWVSSNKYNFKTGDFNGDGKTDLIHFVSDGGPGYVHPWISNGDGTFAVKYFRPDKNYWVSNNNYNFQTGDFNGDGKTDLIHFVNDGGAGYVHPWLSNGDGTFSVKYFKPDQNYWVSNNSFNFKTGDFNGDGKTDLIHFVNDGGAGYVHPWLSNGDGSFAVKYFKPDKNYWVSNNNYNFQTGDFNGDGKTDLIHFVNDGGAGYVHPWLSNGDGTFSVKYFKPDQNYWVSNNSFNFKTGDFNGDGKTDLIHFVNDGGAGYVHPWISNGDGTFSVEIFKPTQGYSVSNNNFKFQTGDFNGDGKTDLSHFVTDGGAGYIHPWISNGDSKATIDKKATKDLEYILNTYYPELVQSETLANLQQEIAREILESEQMISARQSEITRKKSEAAAAISQADWYQEKSAFHWERSHKAGATWQEQRVARGPCGRRKTISITHVDHDWIIWDTYTKQSTTLREYAADLLRGSETDTINKDTTTAILKQWNLASAVANEAALSESEFIHLLQQLEAERKLSEEKLNQISDWEKILPVLKSQLKRADEDATIAGTNVEKELNEYKTSKDDFLGILNSVLEKRAQLQSQSQLLQQDITAAKDLVQQQSIVLVEELNQAQALITQLQSQREVVAQQLINVNETLKENLLTQQAQIDESIQLLSQKQTVLTAQQASLTQKQTLLSTQEQIILIEYQLLDATLASPDQDTSTLEQQLGDTKKTLAEVQKLAAQAEASSQALSSIMEDLQASLLLQNDKYLTAIKDKQQVLKKLLEATELEKNYTLQATTKQQELNTIENQLLAILKQANDAGSIEAAKLLEVANATNIAAAAEIYYRDYRDLATDKGGACTRGIAKPQDLVLAAKYLDEMKRYRLLQEQAQQQVSQFTALRKAAEGQILLLEDQRYLSTQELEQLQQSIGNTQEAIEAHKQEITIAEFRINSLTQLKEWTSQTLTQILTVEKLNLVQAQLEQEIALKREKLLDAAVEAQLEKQRLGIERDRQIAVTKLEQLNQLNTEEALQQAINNLRSEIGIKPIEDLITQAEWKGDLAGILAELEALNSKTPDLSSDFKAILTATTGDIHAALQGKEAATIQENLLKTADGLIEQSNRLSAEIAKLAEEENTYMSILNQSQTNLQAASRALYEEIEKSDVLAQENQIISQKNLEILHKVGFAQGAVEISDDLATQSKEILGQIIEYRIEERKIRQQTFIEELFGLARIVLSIAATASKLSKNLAGSKMTDNLKQEANLLLNNNDPILFGSSTNLNYPYPIGTIAGAAANLNYTLTGKVSHTDWFSKIWDFISSVTKDILSYLGETPQRLTNNSDPLRHILIFGLGFNSYLFNTYIAYLIAKIIEKSFRDNFTQRVDGKEYQAYLQRADQIYAQSAQLTFKLTTQNGDIFEEKGHIFSLQDIEPDRPTYIIVHGWNDKPYSDWVTQLSLMLHGINSPGDNYNPLHPFNVNVLIIDWVSLTDAFEEREIYNNSARYIKERGVVNGIANQLEDWGIKAKDITGIGHSHGAQLLANLSRELQERQFQNPLNPYAGKLNQIIGLDPARPGFEDEISANKLDAYDASNVTIIQSTYNEDFPDPWSPFGITREEASAGQGINQVFQPIKTNDFFLSPEQQAFYNSNHLDLTALTNHFDAIDIFKDYLAFRVYSAEPIDYGNLADGFYDYFKLNYDKLYAKYYEDFYFKSASGLQVGSPPRRTEIGSFEAETLNGSSANDILIGSLGNDILTGGAGKDYFVFNHQYEGKDFITDFNPSDDTILLRSSFFGEKIKENSFPGNFEPIPLHSVNSELGQSTWNTVWGSLIYNEQSGDLSLDLDWNSNTPSISFVKLANKPSLSKSSIWLVY